MSKTYVIGDLHGAFDLLQRAMYAIADDAGQSAKIVLLGDYIDRGPDSRGIISFLMNMEAMGSTVCLQGNHEVMAVETLLGKIPAPWWLGNGGAQTLESYGHRKLKPSRHGTDVHLGVVPDEHIKWMATLPKYHEDEHRVYVHAGVDPHLELVGQSNERLQWFLYPDMCTDGYRGKHVVHGHHFHEDGPHTWGDRTNMDVNAWRTGRLPIAVFDDDTPGPPVKFLEVRRR